MKKSIVFILVVFALLAAVMTVSAYFEQEGTKRWCNVTPDGCTVDDGEGKQVYIMFWSEASRDKIMGPNSNAPISDPFSGSTLPLDSPKKPGGSKSSKSQNSQGSGSGSEGSGSGGAVNCHDYDNNENLCTDQGEACGWTGDPNNPSIGECYNNDIN